MMMTRKEKKRVPELRFVGFEGEWKKLELRKTASINPKNGELPDSFIYVDLESVNNGVLEKEERISKKDAPSRAQRLLERDDILYQTVRPYQKNNLYFDKEDKDYVASTGYAQIRTDNNSKYLYQYVHTALFVNKVLLRCTGTSYPAINSTDLSKIRVSIPSKEEQQKIATFLTSIDTRIQQLEKKKTLLDQYKKGVMQKIFSQEIRFKDDGGKEFGEWQRRRLGEVFKSISTRPYQIKSKDFNPSGKYRIVDQGKDLIAGYSDSVDNVFNDLPIVVFGDHTTIIKFIEFDFIVGADGTKLLKNKRNDNLKYLFYNLSYNNVPQEGYKRHYSMLSEVSLQIPCLAEQTKIAHFLSALDRKIAVTNEQVEETKKWKKGLLQRMFV